MVTVPRDDFHGIEFGEVPVPNDGDARVNFLSLSVGPLRFDEQSVRSLLEFGVSEGTKIFCRRVGVINDEGLRLKQNRQCGRGQKSGQSES